MMIEKKYSIAIPPCTEIGKGLLLDHPGPRIINGNAKIGEFCCIHPNVLIGGDRGKGSPVIGNYVFIGNGCKIIGRCSVGDWCFLAPGSIVTKDIPFGSLVGAGVNNILNHDGKKHVLQYIKYDSINRII